MLNGVSLTLKLSWQKWFDDETWSLLTTPVNETGKYKEKNDMTTIRIPPEQYSTIILYQFKSSSLSMILYNSYMTPAIWLKDIAFF